MLFLKRVAFSNLGITQNDSIERWNHPSVTWLSLQPHRGSHRLCQPKWDSEVVWLLTPVPSLCSPSGRRMIHPFNWFSPSSLSDSLLVSPFDNLAQSWSVFFWLRDYKHMIPCAQISGGEGSLVVEYWSSMHDALRSVPSTEIKTTTMNNPATQISLHCRYCNLIHLLYLGPGITGMLKSMAWCLKAQIWQSCCLGSPSGCTI